MSFKKILIVILFATTCSSICYAQKIDIQGHRGARGLLPENSINGFIKATDLGVTTLELDVVISKDDQVVVSHDPYISGSICLKPTGTSIDTNDYSLNIYQMNYEEVKKYDCGITGNARFSGQEKVTTYKPLLKEVIDIIEKHLQKNNLSKVNYNIEIKSSEKGDNVSHPNPSKFADLVLKVIKEQLPLARFTIQSFDTRPLIYLHKKEPALSLALLVENKINFKRQIKKLGFKPAIYSPYFKLLDRQIISELQKQDIKVIPWTVNEIAEMQLMMTWGVDGIITDYPDRARKLSN